jgi:hypothetical protein
MLCIATLLDSTPPDIWHDPNAIGLMGVAVGVVGIIVATLMTIYAVRQGRIRRRLEYQILSNAPILTLNATVADHVEIDIRVKGVSAKDAHLMVVSLKNTGKVSIHPDEYFEAVIFEFDTEVLSASVLETTPKTLIKSEDLLAFLTLTPQSVQFPKFPLNPKNEIQTNILLERKGRMKVRGRLDQGKVVSFNPVKSSWWKGPVFAGVGALAALAIFVILMEVESQKISLAIAALLIVATGIATLGAELIINGRTDKILKPYIVEVEDAEK